MSTVVAMTSSILPSALPITELGFTKPADAASRIAAARLP
jgi:hypothetical protein